MNWAVIEDVRRDPKQGVIVLAECGCGVRREVRLTAIRAGKSRSCGCVTRARRHGMSGTPVYGVWEAMWHRCTNPNNKKWHLYGGRGISVCESWREFANFAADMGPRPDGLTLDRIDPDGNYEPGNCRWATYLEQSANIRPATECRNGHEWTPETTGYFTLAATGERRRRCLVCRAIREGVTA